MQAENSAISFKDHVSVENTCHKVSIDNEEQVDIEVNSTKRLFFVGDLPKGWSARSGFAK